VRLDPYLTLELAVTARHPLSRLGPERHEFMATFLRTMEGEWSGARDLAHTICYRFVTRDVALTVTPSDLLLMKGHEQ
jgi:hypothetical protein